MPFKPVLSYSHTQTDGIYFGKETDCGLWYVCIYMIDVMGPSLTCKRKVGTWGLARPLHLEVI